jgi:hypothetical protein
LQASLSVVRKSLGRRRKVTGPSRLTSNKVSVQVLAGPTPVLIRRHLRPLATTLLGATAEVMRTQPRVGSSGTLTWPVQSATRAPDVGPIGSLSGIPWSTFGPHAIGAERFATVSSGLKR